MSSKELLRNLLEINSIKINLKNPFNWASGWKSPFYFDNRISLSYPSIRKKITLSLVELCNKYYSDAEVIAGVATAGIPQGSLVSNELNKPFVYIRSKPKSHGMENLIEGRLEKNKKVIVIEDLISTGGSSIKAVEAIRNNGCNVVCVLSIFNYGFDISKTNFSNINCDHKSLYNYDDLLTVALQNNYITQDEIQELKKWRNNPGDWN
jgi:orotate phosphoribosyltransferase|tara:strand:- start:74 stop:697 length:624 start_codon:yes stop_codon:yes gene_type:complete